MYSEQSRGMIFYVFIFLTFLGKLAFWYIISHTRNCVKRGWGLGEGKFLHLAEYVSRSFGFFFVKREYCCYSALALLCCEIPPSRKTKHEACLILHRVPWGQEVSLLPSWRLWVLYNSVHKGPASHSPVINKWAAVQAKPARVLPLSCHRTCFHMRRARQAQHEGWLAASWTPGTASHLSCLVCLIIQESLTMACGSEAQKQSNLTALSSLVSRTTLTRCLCDN